jgi:hypothetical protein
MRRERGKQLLSRVVKLDFVMKKSIAASKPKKKTESASENKRLEIGPHENNKEPRNPFDFGGLPPRDLKKNLGCS